jgi:transposase
VNGRPRLVEQKYLGTAEDIIRRFDTEAPLPALRPPQVLRWGAEAACLRVAEEIGLTALINQFVPKRRQGLTTGEYLLIAAINRCCCPRSKRGIGAWFFNSILARRFPAVRPANLTSQRFWDHLGHVTEDAIVGIETALARRLIELYAFDLATLIYDTTNFFTFINTFNARAPIAQRGHNKQKRFDLRQVNLALLMTKDDQIPLFHHCYEGNRVDSESFQSIVIRLTQRLEQVTGNRQEITLVYDTGNNSENALRHLAQHRYHIVSSLPIDRFPDLLLIPADRYRRLTGERFDGVRAYRQTRLVLGLERTVLVVFSADFYQQQSETVAAMVAKATRGLQALKERLALWENGTYRRGRPPAVTAVTKQVQTILKGQYLKELITVRLATHDRFVCLAYETNEVRWRELAERVFGKRVLFTDQSDWTDEAIVGSYWDKWEIEAAFRQMKDRRHCSWFPMHHWTVQKIKVHAFYCLLALLFRSVLHRKARAAGIPISATELLEQLDAIYQVIISYQVPGKGRKVRQAPPILSARNEIQQRLFDVFGLEF